MDVEPGVLFEFVLVLKGDPHGIQKLPDYFAEYVTGEDRPRTMHHRRWTWSQVCCSSSSSSLKVLSL
jgi:hypothetical protein